MMKFSKTLLFSLGCSLMFGAANAQVNSQQNPAQAPQKPFVEKTSEPGTIIFRIENIEPIKNKDNLVKSCSFVFTVYNRMDKAVKEANLDLAWRDRVSQKYITRINTSSAVSGEELAEATGNEHKEVEKLKNKSKAPVATNSYGDDVLLTDIKIFNIAPHTQKSFSKTVETSKCFMLFDNLEYRVRDCILDGEEKNAGNKNDLNVGCMNRFGYISSKNPEYYSEFGDTPLDVAQNQAEDDQKMEMKKFQEEYDHVANSVATIKESLEKIK